MTPLALEMIKRRFKNKRERGTLLLLLMLSSAYLIASLPFSQVSEDATGDEGVFLQIEGDVYRAGTYSFPSEAFLEDLIDAAKGLCIKKDLPVIYKNRPLQNGVKVNIEWDGTSWRISLNEISAFNKLTLGIPISINNESREGLTALPGIGQKLGERIVEERKKRGGFSHISDLKDIKGIGERLFQRIVKQITL